MFLTKEVASAMVFHLLADLSVDGHAVLTRKGGEPWPELRAPQVRMLLACLLGFPDDGALANALHSGFECPRNALSREAGTAARNAGFHWRAIQLAQKHLAGGMPGQIAYAPESEESLRFSGYWPDHEFIRAQAALCAASLLEDERCLDAQPEGCPCVVFAMDDVDFETTIEDQGTRRLSAIVMAQFHEPLDNGEPNFQAPFVGLHLRLDFELGHAGSKGLATYVNPLGYTAWGFCTIDPRKANGG